MEGVHMRGIPVLFNDNHYDVVSGNELDQLLTTGRVKAFRRSTGWAIIGHAPLRRKANSPRSLRVRKEEKNEGDCVAVVQKLNLNK